MEQIANVQPTPRRAERNNAAQTAAALLADPFLLIFQQLMETSGGSLEEEHSQNTPGDEQNPQAPAMMQLANGLFLNGAPAPVVVDATQEVAATQLAPVTAQSQTGPTPLQAASIPLQSASIPLQAAPIPLAAAPTTPHATQTQPAAAEPAPIPILQAEYHTQNGEAQTGEQREKGYEAPSQFQFQHDIAEAKRQMAATRPSLRGQPEDDTTAGGPMPQSAPAPTPSAGVAQKSEQIAAEPRLLEQLKTGLKEHLNLGENEFTMKLKPEALGEITVKLTEKAGKTTLTIVTASAQTAKLINADLSALREAVRPMQVEVREAIPQQSESPQAQMHQFDMSGQQHLFQQQQQQQQHSGSHHSPVPLFAQEGEDIFPEEHPDTTLLDTYI